MCELEPGNTRQHPSQIQEIMHALIDTHEQIFFDAAFSRNPQHE